MYPALHPKDRIMFTRLNKADPKPGDVLVMKSPHQAHARVSSFSFDGWLDGWT